MSDPKRATLITVGASKSAKDNVTKTVRLNINLEESNESKYPELNYKELVISQERKKKVVNGKTDGLDPFSDNDDDVERVARKFEQKYGGKSTYGRRGKTKHDEFADIGAGYDENDSFIDNTDGYDEMIPPECDTLYGGFYINCGSLEFKSVPEKQPSNSDTEPHHHRNKRRISSSSSADSSASSSSEAANDKEKVVPNGDISTHDKEHRKKKVKKIDKAKRIKRNDSSAATSGKQTSDDADSRTSHSADSLTCKPAQAQSSENAATSDSSRDAPDSKLESALPPPVRQIIDDIKNTIAKQQLTNSHLTIQDIAQLTEQHVLRLDKALTTLDSHTQKCGWVRVARLLGTSRNKLLQRLKTLQENAAKQSVIHNNIAPPSISNTQTSVNQSHSQKRKKAAAELDKVEADNLTPEQRQQKIVETIERLKVLIEERKPQMLATYKMECDKVQEERKKSVALGGEGTHVERRMPRRRFPWCGRARTLVGKVAQLAGNDAQQILAARVLPLFPKGFVRMPTLLRQADVKINETKRQKTEIPTQPPPVPQTAPLPNTSAPLPNTSAPLPNTSAPLPNTSAPLPNTTAPRQPFSEPINFPSSLTVTAMPKLPDKPTDTNHKSESKSKQTNDKSKPISDKSKQNSTTNQTSRNFTHLTNNVSSMPQNEKKEVSTLLDNAKEKYTPPTSIGSIIITPVNNATQKPEKSTKIANSVSIFEKANESLIRVKSPAALMKEADDIAHKNELKKDKPKEKRINSPLHIDTAFKPKDKVQNSPINRKEELKNQLDTLRYKEDKIPRPGLIPVHLSPTFAKPDKKPQETKKRKDIVIITDVDPLSDSHVEPLAVDDSSSDVEVIEDNKLETTQKSNDKTADKTKCGDKQKSVEVPCVNKSVQSRDLVRVAKDKVEQAKKCDRMDVEESDTDIDVVMKNLRDLQDSQDQNTNTNSFSGVKNEQTSLNKMDGCSTVPG